MKQSFPAIALENHGDVRQFRLTDGVEIIGKVIEWNMSGSDEIVMNNVMQLVAGQTGRMTNPATASEEVFHYYTFRPWMVFQEGDSNLVVLRGTHVIGEAIPIDRMIDRYEVSVQTVREALTAAAAKADQVQSGMEEGIDAINLGHVVPSPRGRVQ